RAVADAGRGVRRARRIRRAVASARAASAVLGLVEPDPERHPHLVTLTPSRLRALWLATTAALWTWAAAWVVGAVAVLDLLLRSLG
ncbi:MAG: hypothetical protein KDA94_16510, partial [Acidimicrobiales bacterium]|nr:hypothetical protein [Acidimicrobiales bacterium]